LADACVYVYGDAAFGFTSTSTDDQGDWTAGNLPANQELAVLVVPKGSCGELPTTATEAGELQPEFYSNTWANLSDPALQDNPRAWASDSGAQLLTGSTDGVNVCLTTAAGSATRSECEDPSTTTDPTQPLAGLGATLTTRTFTVSSRTTAAGAAASTKSLPHTGQPISSLVSTGCAALILGAVLVRVGKRRRDPKPRHL